MKYIVLFLLFLSCSQAPAPKEVQAAEEEFVAPENPFDEPQPEPVLYDSSNTARKAERPGIKPAVLEFEKKEYLFDSIPAGKPFIYELKFSNSGERPLEIRKVLSSSDAILRWPVLLFAAGETGVIRAKLDLKGKNGKITDTLRIYSNAEKQELKLIIEGTVR